VKILAVDYGTRRTGLAVSTPDESIALSLPTIEHADAEAVAAVAREQGAGLVVVGLPINMDGTEGPAAGRSRQFGAELVVASGLPVTFWDERLTTAEGDSRLRAHGLRRKDRARRSDAAAAIVLLEAYLAARRKGTA
jgi:putative Holliday junction resolvase